MTPDRLMIFAAGHGTRMRHLTQDIPKPMIPIAGIPMIDRALDHADQAGVKNRVVNTHYLGDSLSRHLAHRPNLHISHEPDEALETGGGLKAALPLLGPDPVFTLNPDALWTGRNPLTQLADHWTPAGMDALLLLVPIKRALGHVLGGDFAMDEQGRLTRAAKNDPNAFVYTGAQILRTDGLADFAARKFSLNLLWDRMIADGRLFGCLHDGDWVSVGTPEALALAEAHLNWCADV